MRLHRVCIVAPCCSLRIVRACILYFFCRNLIYCRLLTRFSFQFNNGHQLHWMLQALNMLPNPKSKAWYHLCLASFIAASLNFLHCCLRCGCEIVRFQCCYWPSVLFFGCLDLHFVGDYFSCWNHYHAFVSNRSLNWIFNGCYLRHDKPNVDHLRHLRRVV